MLSDVPTSYIKSVGQGAWAAHTEREIGVEKKASRRKKDDINTGRDMVNSGGSVPAVVCLANLCVALCVGGKIIDFLVVAGIAIYIFVYYERRHFMINCHFS